MARRGEHAPDAGRNMAALEGTAWEHDVKARLIARDDAALGAL